MIARASLHQLRCFCAVAETGHFGRAAARMGISQPSLSLQIRKFEDLLGLTLVERGRRCCLSPAGREILPLAHKALQSVDALGDKAQALRAGARRNFRLGSSPTIGPYLLPRVTQELQRKAPALGLVIREATTRDLIDGCLGGRHDAILVQLPVAAEGLVARRLFREPLRLVVPAGHRLAGRAEAEPADLRGERVLTLGSSYALHDQTARLCEAWGATLLEDYEGTNLDALKQMTALNLGVSLIPAIYAASQIAPDDPSVRVLPFSRHPVWRSIGLAYRSSRTGEEDCDLLADVLRRVAAGDFGNRITVEG